jgi:hypothetical protein
MIIKEARVYQDMRLQPFMPPTMDTVWPADGVDSTSTSKTPCGEFPPFAFAWLGLVADDRQILIKLFPYFPSFFLFSFSPVLHILENSGRFLCSTVYG